MSVRIVVEPHSRAMPLTLTAASMKSKSCFSSSDKKRRLFSFMRTAASINFLSPFSMSLARLSLRCWVPPFLISFNSFCCSAGRWLLWERDESDLAEDDEEDDEDDDIVAWL